jgi:L-asparaginase
LEEVMSEPILILTTGGTIDKQYFDALSRFQITDTTVAGLLERGRVRHPYRIEEVLKKDSIDMTEEDRARIVEQVRGSKLNRVIITHGTDTMTQTAKALSSIPGKIIILTGALAPSRFSDSDAAFNLGMAFATAQTAHPGVYITINGSVFLAEQVEKDRAHGCFVRKRIS